MITARELLDAASNCLTCGKPHPVRDTRDFRGSPMKTTHARGHLPVRARQFDGPALLYALERLRATLSTPADGAKQPPSGDAERQRAAGAASRRTAKSADAKPTSTARNRTKRA